MERLFEAKDLKKMWKIDREVTKFGGGQVSIVGGSKLFHGAPILALKAASRIVDMVYWATWEGDKGVADHLKSQLSAFIWIPRDEIDDYVVKSDAALVGPGLMRYGSEKGIISGWVCDMEGRKTKKLTEDLLRKHFERKWVIDGGSLQVMDPRYIPPRAVVTPNSKEYRMLFGQLEVDEAAKKYSCVIVSKGPVTRVSDGEVAYIVKGGSPGLIKGGTGDVLAGVTVGLVAKNEPLLAAAAASWLVMKAGEELEKERGIMFNADDVADRIPLVFGKYV